MSFGPIAGIIDVKDCFGWAESAQFTGVVLNRGMIGSLSPDSPLGLVLQTFGSPALNGAEDKALLIPPPRTVSIASDAVAVELDLGGTAPGRALQAVSLVLTAYKVLAIPVLLMLKPRPDLDAVTAFTHAVRLAAELGADLVKIGLPPDVIRCVGEDLDNIRKIITLGPPLLLAGGPRTVDFSSVVSVAKRLGFQGVCVGRNVFQASDPRRALATMREIFRDSRDEE